MKLKKFLLKHKENLILSAILIIVLILAISFYGRQHLAQKKETEKKETEKICEECYARGSADTRDKIFEIVLSEGGVNIQNSGGQLLRLILLK